MSESNNENTATQSSEARNARGRTAWDLTFDLLHLPWNIFLFRFVIFVLIAVNIGFFTISSIQKYRELHSIDMIEDAMVKNIQENTEKMVESMSNLDQIFNSQRATWRWINHNYSDRECLEQAEISLDENGFYNKERQAKATITTMRNHSSVNHLFVVNCFNDGIAYLFSSGIDEQFMQGQLNNIFSSLIEKLRPPADQSE